MAFTVHSGLTLTKSEHPTGPSRLTKAHQGPPHLPTAPQATTPSPHPPSRTLPRPGSPPIKTPIETPPNRSPARTRISQRWEAHGPILAPRPVLTPAWPHPADPPVPGSTSEIPPVRALREERGRSTAGVVGSSAGAGEQCRAPAVRAASLGLGLGRRSWRALQAAQQWNARPCAGTRLAPLRGLLQAAALPGTRCQLAWISSTSLPVTRQPHRSRPAPPLPAASWQRMPAALQPSSIALDAWPR